MRENKVQIKNINYFSRKWLIISGLIVLIFLLYCEPLVYTFDPIEGAVSYQADQLRSASATPDSLKVLSWNIRFGAGRLPWFGDACGKRVILTAAEIKENLNVISSSINTWDVDLVLLQEVDVQSKRSAYIDQVQWLLDHTEMNYGVYAPVWHAQYIPSDGLGRMNMGTAILSRWPLDDAQRIALPLRGDQDALTKYFYLRRNMLKAKLRLPGNDSLYVLNIHTAAFSTDDTKRRHIQLFLEELNDLDQLGLKFVAGGDLNELPPGSDSTDFCFEDGCADESFHHPGDKPFHKEGSDYTAEQDWLTGLYEKYTPAIALQQYQQNQGAYFTHTTNHPNGAWDRKLDYLFTNGHFVEGSTIVHQQVHSASDHAALGVIWRVSQ